MRYIAFLRAINVSTHVVSMERLRSLFSSLGLEEVETFINSGNVIFRSSRKPELLQREIEGCLQRGLGFEAATFLRSDIEVAEIARKKLFPQAAIDSAGAYCVLLLDKPLAAGARKKVLAMRSEIDDLQATGREVYWLCRRRQSESKLSNASLEKLLGVRSTMRGMNTVQRLAAKYPPA